MISIIVNEGRFPEYFDDADPERVRKWEESILSLQSLGWVGVDFGKGA